MPLGLATSSQSEKPRLNFSRAGNQPDRVTGTARIAGSNSTGARSERYAIGDFHFFLEIPCAPSSCDFVRPPSSSSVAVVSTVTIPWWEQDVGQFAKSQRLTLAQAEQHRSTGEHLLAQCDGGRDCTGNVFAAYLVCNQRRHRGRQQKAPSAAVYRARVQQLLIRGR